MIPERLLINRSDSEWRRALADWRAENSYGEFVLGWRYNHNNNYDNNDNRYYYYNSNHYNYNNDNYYNSYDYTNHYNRNTNNYNYNNK